MLRNALITLYPWDIVEGDVGALLDRLQGEVGVTGVALWVACPPTVHLRSRDVKPRLIRSAGGLFFRPTLDIYAATNCKPVPTESVREHDPLPLLAEACAARRLELRLRASCTLIGGVVSRYPSTATVNVFGDASITSVCLANPDVQGFLSALAADVTSRASIAGLELADSVIAWHEACSVRAAVPLGEAERVLLSSCFCEACRGKAAERGVNVAAAQRTCQILLNSAFEDPLAKGTRLSGLLAENAALRNFFEWRSNEIAQWLKQVAAASRCEILLDRSFDPIEVQQHDPAVLSVPAAVLSRLDRVSQLDALAKPGIRRYELRIPAALAVGSNGPDLVRSLSQAVLRGVSGVVFDTYGLLPDSSLTFVRQAIRYARRANLP